MYGYPLDEAAPLALQMLLAHLEAGRAPWRLLMVLYDERTLDAYDRALHELAPSRG